MKLKPNTKYKRVMRPVGNDRFIFGKVYQTDGEGRVTLYEDSWEEVKEDGHTPQSVKTKLVKTKRVDNFRLGGRSVSCYERGGKIAVHVTSLYPLVSSQLRQLAVECNALAEYLEEKGKND